MHGEEYLKDMKRQMRKLKELADTALSKIKAPDMFARLGNESNSIAIIMKHMAGNMRARWTDFLSTDGDAGRQRDAEFQHEETDTKESLFKSWEDGWQRLFGALDILTTEDLDKTVTIRQIPHTVPEAIHRQLSHYAYHVGQIALLAKHYAGKDWQKMDDLYKTYKQF